MNGLEIPYAELGPLGSVGEALRHYTLTLTAAALWSGIAIYRAAKHKPPSRAVWWPIPFFMWAFAAVAAHLRPGLLLCCTGDDVWRCDEFLLNHMLLELYRGAISFFLLLLIMIPGFIAAKLSFERTVDKLALMGTSTALFVVVLDYLFESLVMLAWVLERTRPGVF